MRYFIACLILLWALPAQAQFSLQALADELNNDPATIGYAAAGWPNSGDQEVANLLNAKTFTIDAATVEMEIVRRTTTYNAYNTLAIDEQEYLTWVTPNGGLLRVTADLKLQLTGRSAASGGVAGAGSDNASWWSAAERGAMAPAFLALIEIAGSRAEVLWGQNIVITASQVGAAANCPCP